MVSTLMVVVGYYMDELFFDSSQDDKQNTAPFNYRSIPTVVGIAMYSFEAIGTLLNIRISMEEPHRFSK